MTRVIIFLAFPYYSHAQWSTNSAVNNVLSVAANNQWNVATNNQWKQFIISDGSGGAIVVWKDERNGTTNGDVFAQRIDVNGVVQWTTDGVAICTQPYDQLFPTLTTDGSGGAIITWYDCRRFASTSTTDIYAQRISSAGVPQWATDGVVICTQLANKSQQYPNITSDGSGGAIITWYGLRNSGPLTNEIYAQRIDGSGNVLWPVNGVSICSATNSQYYPTIASDGAGGAIISWYDYRSSSNYDIYAQRVDGSGVVQWATDGLAVCTAINNNWKQTMISDGSGGAIIVWHDYRAGATADIYAQRVDASGVMQWTTDGVAICTAANDQSIPTMITDGSGGCIITWHDARVAGNDDVYAQRVNASGAVQWTADGIAICAATGSQHSPTIISDGSGGAYITWYDLRNGTNWDVYAQRINLSGVSQWITDGVDICTAAGNQWYPQLAPSTCGAIIAWHDYRGGTYNDMYAQQVSPAGVLGGTCPLPLELILFTAHYSGRENILEWKTGSEINNDFFAVERSYDGKNFEEIGKVRGAGNASVPRNYSFTDPHALSKRMEAGEEVYYRLKQVDFDGRFIYSNTVSVTRPLNHQISVYPIPSGKEVTCSFYSSGKSEVKIVVSDLMGSILMSENRCVVSGENSFRMDISRLPHGIYFIIVSDGLKQDQTRFIKE